MRRLFATLLLTLVPATVLAQQDTALFLQIYNRFLETHKLTQSECLTLKKLCEKEKDEDLCFTSVDLCLASKQKNAALEIAKAGTQVLPKSSKMWYQLGKLLIINNRISEGESALKKSLKLNPKNKGIYEILIKLYLFSGEKEKALSLAKRMARIFPNSPDSHFFMGKVLYELGRIQKAKESLEKARKLGCRRQELFNLLSSIYMRLGRYKDAAHLYEEMIGKGIISETVVRNLISAYINSEQFEKAAHVLERLYKIHKDSRIRDSLLIVYLKLNRLKEAESLCKQQQEASVPCMVLLCLEGKEGFGLKTEGEKLVEAARVAADTGHKDCAIKFLDAALVKSPEDARLYSELSMIQLYSNMPDRALTNARIAVKLDPQNPELRFREGVILERQGKVKEACKAIEAAIELSRSPNPTYLNYLGYLLIVRNIDVKRGIELVKKALSIRPNNSSYMDSLAWGYYKEGRLKEALKLQEKAYEKQPHNAVITYHLGEIYLATGKRKRALELFKKAEKLLPKEKDLSPWEKREIEERLRKLLH